MSVENPGLGLANPPLDGQSIFRAMLDAMARPGTIHRPGGLPDDAGPNAALVGTALTLLDHDTAVWLEPDNAELRRRLAFHCGCPVVERADGAAFAILTDAGGFSNLGWFAQGSPEFPDRSTTIICALPSLDGGPELVLRGPGIDGERAFAPTGLPDEFASEWTLNNERYPLGIDLILTAGPALSALPRTSRFEG